MHIGIAGPVDLEPLRHRIAAAELPATYSFPLIGKLAEELLILGHEVSVFAESTSIATPQLFEGSKLRVFACPMRPRRAAYDFYRPEREHLVAAMKQSGCDLIHAHWAYEFAAAALDSGLPCLITAHDSPLAILRYFVLTRYFPFWTARAVLGASVIRRAKRMTTVSPYCKRDIERLLRPSAPITVVPNGVGQEILRMGRTRLDRGRPPLPLTLATVLEGFQERKNPKAAIRAFASVRKVLPDATLMMFGNGYETGGLAETWCRDQSLFEGIEFRGKVAHATLMQELARHVHILVHPAKEESFGMAPLEAIALGILVIGGKSSGGVPYVLGGGKAGKLVDVHNPIEIAQAVLELAQRGGQMDGLAETCWQHAVSSFSLEKMVDKYLAEYAATIDAAQRTTN